MTAEPVPLVLDDSLVWPLASALLMCVCAEMPTTPGGDVCSCSLVPGATVPMDWCGCDGDHCGMAWVRVDSIFPSNRFPATLNEPTGCAGPFAARLHVGAFRCLPTVGAGGEPPSAADQSEAVRITLGDMAGLRRAISCCPEFSQRKLLLGAWTNVSAADCGGGFWPVTVQVM